MFSIYPNIKAPRTPHSCNLEQAVERIRSGKSQKLISQIRQAQDKDERNTLKARLPVYTFSGDFKYRSIKGINKHSGLLTLDFDDCPDPAQLRTELSQSPYTLAAFISPSGNGVKLIIRIPANIDEHENRFIAAAEHFQNPWIDLSTKDISRACYESYDEDIYYNPEAQVFTEIHNPLEVPDIESPDEVMTGVEALEWIEARTNERVIYADGHKHKHLGVFALIANRCGIDRMDVINYYESNFDKKDVTKNVNYVYQRNAADHNTRPIQRSKSQREQPQAARNDTDMPRVETFWRVSVSKKGSIDIHFKRFDFLKWLQSQGIARYYYDEAEKDWLLIRITENIVFEIDVPYIKKIVFDYIKTLPEQFDNINRVMLYEFIMKGATNYFSTPLLEFLPRKDVNWCRDDKDTAYFFFKNTAVKVTADQIQQIPYTDLPGKIWKRQRLKRDYCTGAENGGQYERFIQLTQDNNQARTTALKSMIGYILHTYKDPSVAKAIIINDKQVSESPEGGTGKGLFIKSFSHIRRLVIIPGKGFNFDKNFAFQRVELGTQILSFEDVEKRFDFEKMFSVITDGLSVEKKGMQEIFMKFEESPKILITTNYTIKGEGNSHDRRREEVEFGRYFIDTTPVQEFGGRLFDDWDQDEFCKYFQFMLECTQLYLQHGIVKPPLENLRLRKLIEETHPDFVLWACDFIKTNTPYSRSEFYKSFTEREPDFQKYKQNTITKWVKKFAAFAMVETVERKSSGSRVMTFRGFFPEIVCIDGVFSIAEPKPVTPEPEDDDCPF